MTDKPKVCRRCGKEIESLRPRNAIYCILCAASGKQHIAVIPRMWQAIVELQIRVDKLENK